LSKRYLTLPILLVFLFFAALSLGLPANNASNVEDNATNVEIAASSLNNTTPTDEAMAAEKAALEIRLLPSMPMRQIQFSI